MKAILLTLLALSSAINVQAALVTKPITYEDKGTKLVGYLAYDDAVASKGKPPGILVIHEWWGLNDYIKGRAEQLAKMGYVAFAADIYEGFSWESFVLSGVACVAAFGWLATTLKLGSPNPR